MVVYFVVYDKTTDKATDKATDRVTKGVESFNAELLMCGMFFVGTRRAVSEKKMCHNSPMRAMTLLLFFKEK